MNDENIFIKRRDKMLREITDREADIRPDILEAVATIPRHLFLPVEFRESAYSLSAVSLDGYSMSDPGLVAYMVSKLTPSLTERCLDIGSGTGFHAALLSRVCKEVVGVERLNHAVERSRKSLLESDITNVRIIHGNGFEDIDEHRQFDLINVACGLSRIPWKLVESRLAVGGRMIFPYAPEGLSPYKAFQKLSLLTKNKSSDERDGVEVYSLCTIEDLRLVRFMTADDE